MGTPYRWNKWLPIDCPTRVIREDPTLPDLLWVRIADYLYP